MKAGSVVAATVITSPLFGLRPCQHRAVVCVFRTHKLDAVKTQSPSWHKQSFQCLC